MYTILCGFVKIFLYASDNLRRRGSSIKIIIYNYTLNSRYSDAYIAHDIMIKSRYSRNIYLYIYYVCIIISPIYLRTVQCPTRLNDLIQFPAHHHRSHVHTYIINTIRMYVKQNYRRVYSVYVLFKYFRNEFEPNAGEKTRDVTTKYTVIFIIARILCDRICFFELFQRKSIY